MYQPDGQVRERNPGESEPRRVAIDLGGCRVCVHGVERSPFSEAHACLPVRIHVDERPSADAEDNLCQPVADGDSDGDHAQHPYRPFVHAVQGSVRPEVPTRVLPGGGGGRGAL